MEGKKVIAWIAGSVVIGGGIYLLIQEWKKFKANNTGGNAPAVNMPGISSFVKTVLAPKDDSFPLSIGSRGNNVKYLQTALNSLGASLAVDGVFGQKTYRAAVQFGGTSSQYWTNSNGLTVNGFNAILAKANGSSVNAPAPAGPVPFGGF